MYEIDWPVVWKWVVWIAVIWSALCYLPDPKDKEKK